MQFDMKNFKALEKSRDILQKDLGFKLVLFSPYLGTHIWGPLERWNDGEKLKMMAGTCRWVLTQFLKPGASPEHFSFHSFLWMASAMHILTLCTCHAFFLLLPNVVSSVSPRRRVLESRALAYTSHNWVVLSLSLCCWRQENCIETTSN